jgi:hypothetical protein
MGIGSQYRQDQVTAGGHVRPGCGVRVVLVFLAGTGEGVGVGQGGQVQTSSIVDAVE